MLKFKTDIPVSVIKKKTSCLAELILDGFQKARLINNESCVQRARSGIMLRKIRNCDLYVEQNKTVELPTRGIYGRIR